MSPQHHGIHVPHPKAGSHGGKGNDQENPLFFFVSYLLKHDDIVRDTWILLKVILLLNLLWYIIMFVYVYCSKGLIYHYTITLG